MYFVLQNIWYNGKQFIPLQFQVNIYTLNQDL